MDALLKDIRFALRSLRNRPVFTAIAVLSLALGIGANGAIFSMVNGMLLRPLDGVVDEDRLVRVYSLSKSFDFPLGLSYPNYLDIVEGTGELITDAGAQMPLSVGIAVGDQPARVHFGGAIVGDFFGTLGTNPALGRLITPEDVEAYAPLIVVSHAFWQERMSGSPEAAGQTVRVNGQPFTVAGVAPPGFTGTDAMLAPEFWLPGTAAEALIFEGWLEDRDSLGLRTTARLRDGVDLETFAAALEPVSQNLQTEFPEVNSGIAHQAMPETDARLEAGLGDASKLFAAILMALVAGVLLIACANVANLLLARADSRRRELSLRIAIGAGRGQLIRQQLAESLLLAAAGGVLGLGLAVVTGKLLAGFSPPTAGVPVRLEADPDFRVYLFTGLVALTAGLVFGLLPALRASKTDPAQGLRTAPGTVSGKKFRLGSALVIAQVALSLVLLIAAGLFLRSMQNARHVDLGFQTADRGGLTVDSSTVGMDQEQGRLFQERLKPRLEAIAGVESVAFASPLPMDWYANGAELGFDRDLGEDLGDEMLVLASRVGVDYFATVQTPILEGRAFVETDDRDHPHVLIVNQTLAERVWPGESALGKTVRLGGRDGEPAEVVGVVPTGKYRLPGEAPRPYAYLPLEQSFRHHTTIVLHSRQPLGPILEQARAEVLALEPDLAIEDASALDVRIGSRIVGPMGLIASMAGTFGLVGLMLAAIGLYGVMALQVVQRTREIGVRMALGAKASQVLGGVLKRGVLLAGIGIVIGAGLSFAATRVMGNFLVGITPNDPVTFVAVIVALTVVAVLASLVPALRAAHIDPVRTLKAE